jgi:hypothetical protein
VVLDDFVEDFVGLFGLSIHHPTGGADVVGVFFGDELVDDKRFEEFEGHLLRQTTLVELELGTNDDNGTTGVVDTLSEEVLTEPSLLAFEGISKRAERPTLTGRGSGRSLTATSRVVEEGVDSLLEHTLFIARDDFWSTNRHQLLQTVVAVDDTAVEIVQVRGRKSATIESHHRTEIRWDDRDSSREHPLETEVGLLKTLVDLETLEELLLINGFVG